MKFTCQVLGENAQCPSTKVLGGSTAPVSRALAPFMVINFRSAPQTRKTYVQDANLREAAKTFPLLANVVLVANDDDVLQLFVVEVAGAQRHNEAA